MDGYFTTLAGRILNPERGVSGLGLDGLQEVVFNGKLRGGAVRCGGKAAEVPDVGEWQCTFCGATNCWNTRLSCYRCGTPRYWQSGVLDQGGLGGVQGKGSSVGAGVVGKGSGWGGFFFGQGGVGSAMGGMRLVGPTGRAQTYTSQDEPTFRKGGGAKGGAKGAGVPGAVAGGVRFEEGVWGGGVGFGWSGRGGGTVASWCCSLAEGPGSWCFEGVCSGAWTGGGVAGCGGWWRGCCPSNQPLLSLPPPRMQRWWPACMSFSPLKRG